MEHLHSVIDTDTRFKIDPITRQIKNDSHKKIVLVQNDHNSEIFTFECPRTIEGHDMSLCNEVEIHFLNISKKDNKEKSGFYTVKDFKVDPEDESKVVCSWVIDRNATGLVGSLVFLVRYKCKEDNIITYDWHTEIFKGITISDGINADERFEGDYVDVIDRWKDSVMAHFTAELAAWKARTVVEVKEEAFDEIATERKRIDLLSNYVTPEMFGAVGDGVTDDTEAFQQALGYPCYVPKGTYLISETLTVNNDLIGFSKGTATIKASGCDVVFNVTNAVSLTIKNINILGTKTETAFSFENIRNSSISDIRIEKCAKAFHFVDGCWANTFANLNVFDCDSAFYNESTDSRNLSTTILRDCYIGTCANAFEITGTSLDIFGGWIEHCDKVFNIKNNTNLLSIGCVNVDFEKNGILFEIGGGNYTTNVNRFSFRDCPFVDFDYWFKKTTSVNIPLYFDVTGSMIGKPLHDIFTEDSLWCDWGTNLPEYYLKRTYPRNLYMAKTSAVFNETVIPVSLIVDSEYTFPEQVFLSSINIPEGTNVVVHGWDGAPFTWTLTGSGEFKAVTKPCYKLVFSKQPTVDVPIKLPRGANVLAK